jgi:cytochrome c
MRASLFALAAGLLLGAPLQADALAEGEALVKKSGCMACHQVSRKVIGPSYVDVAKKYKGKAGAPAQLVQKVKKGGSGVWGAIPMTPHPQLADGDIGKMVDWILSLGGAAAAKPQAAAPKAEPAPKAAATAVPKAEPKAEAGDGEGPPTRKKKKKAGHAVASHAKAPALKWSTDEQVRALMTKNDCFGCHSGVNSLDEPLAKPWPSFKQIEARHRSGADRGALVKKVSANQGRLSWGGVPHPTYPSLPHEAVDAMVSYVLAGKASQAATTAAVGDLPAEEWMRTRSDCFTCHAVNRKVQGPSYQEVAKRYSEKDVPMLVKKVKEGGSGVWGTVPMTAHPTAPDDMLEKSVRWILTHK